MRFDFRCALVGLALLAGGVADAAAQTLFKDTFGGLRASTVGGLTPLMTPAMLADRQSGVGLALRFGLADQNGVRTNAVAGSAIVDGGELSTMLLTVGVSDADCAQCAPGLMVGGGGNIRVYEGGDVANNGSGVTVALHGEAGTTQLRRQSDDRWETGLAVGTPVTVTFVVTTDGMRVSPFFMPAIGMGWSSSALCQGVPSPCDGTSGRLMIGGGIGIWNPSSGVTASIGVSHVSLEDARPVFGVNVTMGRR